MDFIVVSHKRKKHTNKASSVVSKRMAKKATTKNDKKKMQSPYVFTQNRYEPLSNISQNDTSVPAPKRPDMANTYVKIKEENGSPHNYPQFRATLKKADKDGQTLTYPPTVVKISKDTIAVNAASL